MNVSRPTQSICVRFCLWHNPTSRKTWCQWPIIGLVLVAFWLSCLEICTSHPKTTPQDGADLWLWLNSTGFWFTPPTYLTTLNQTFNLRLWAFWTILPSFNSCALSAHLTPERHDFSKHKLICASYNTSNDVICYAHTTSTLWNCVKTTNTSVG